MYFNKICVTVVGFLLPVSTAWLFLKWIKWFENIIFYWLLFLRSDRHLLHVICGQCGSRSANASSVQSDLKASLSAHQSKKILMYRLADIVSLKSDCGGASAQSDMRATPSALNRCNYILLLSGQCSSYIRLNCPHMTIYTNAKRFIKPNSNPDNIELDVKLSNWTPLKWNEPADNSRIHI